MWTIYAVTGFHSGGNRFRQSSFANPISRPLTEASANRDELSSGNTYAFTIRISSAGRGGERAHRRPVSLLRKHDTTGVGLLVPRRCHGCSVLRRVDSRASGPRCQLRPDYWGLGSAASASDRTGSHWHFVTSPTGPAFMVVDAAKRPVGSSPVVGEALGREQVIGKPIATTAFALCDCVYAQDGRIDELRRPPSSME